MTTYFDLLEFVDCTFVLDEGTCHENKKRKIDPFADMFDFFKRECTKISKEDNQKAIFINHTQPEIKNSLISATKSIPKRRKPKPTAPVSVKPKPKLEQNVEIALKKNYANKVRSSLPKSCSNVKCSHKQYFETEEDAEKNLKNFDTTKGQTTMCPCGHYIRYFINNTRVSNASLSKIKKQK
jgi:hypothetical protein